MNRGRILQVGGPRDIYDRPAERFVANFIGETNFLKGTFHSMVKGEAKVTLDEGATVMAGVSESFKPSGPITVVVRPEHAVLTANAKGATLSGVLENIVYFGTDTHYHVKLAKGSPFIVRQQNSKVGSNEFRMGSAVGIVLEGGAAQVLKD
jgi:spermidine/putrescine transport system ATP-binding protein